MKKRSLEQLGRITVPEFKNSVKTPVCIVLDNIRSLNNVGSAFRTSDAFRIEKIYLTGITGIPPHRDIQKTALGATESVVWEYVEKPEDAVATLRHNGYRIVIVEQTDESKELQDFSPSIATKYCFVFGNEINGVSDPVLGLADEAVEIPQWGTKHSLNISVCLGIVIWEVYRKINLRADSLRPAQ